MERVADYIIRKVRETGAGHIFMITGRGILYLTDAVARNQNIKHISTYHEQGASYAAMAYALSNGGISACLVSSGCAASNAVTAALCAYQDNLPVVFISGNNFLQENTRHTNVPIRTYGSQEVDIVKIVESVTKYAVMLEYADQVVLEVEKALFYAQNGRKGPVWIDVPLDVQNMRIEEEKLEHFMEPGKDSESLQKDLQNSAEIIAEEFNHARRPVLLIGGGVRDAADEVKKLIEKYQIPLAFSPAASDIYGAGHALSIGAVGSLGGTRAGNFAVQNADYILAVGTKLCSQETGMKNAFAREAKIIVVDIDKKEHTKKGVHIDRVINADAKEFLTVLANQNFSTTSRAWAEKCMAWKETFSIQKEKFIQELIKCNILDLYQVADMLSDWISDDATVITDAGFEELIIPSTIRFKEGQRCLFPASQGAMGYAIPAILGAFYSGRKNIICVVGDGSFMMNMQELQVISSFHIPVKLFVISNNMYAVIRKRQKDLFRKRTIGNDPSDGVSVPDFKRIAESFGLPYRKVSNRLELEKYKEQLLEDNITEIIEVCCTPEQKYLHESYEVNERKKLVHRPIEDMAPFLEREVIQAEMLVKMMEE